MKEYTVISLTEYENGYTVVGYNGTKQHFSEVHEERIKALETLERWVRFEIEGELERRIYASAL